MLYRMLNAKESGFSQLVEGPKLCSHSSGDQCEQFLIKQNKYIYMKAVLNSSTTLATLCIICKLRQLFKTGKITFAKIIPTNVEI
jgi:hypothetical protein